MVALAPAPSMRRDEEQRTNKQKPAGTPKASRHVRCLWMRSHADIIEHKAQAQPSQPQTDWSGWDQWLQARLSTELNSLHRALGQLLGEEREKLERKTQEFSVKLAKLAGAVDVLRGAAPLPPAKFPSVKAWSEDTVYHEGDIVTFAGGTYQAQRNTARAPSAKDWICLAVAGAGFTVRGTYAGGEKYKNLDVVMMNGSSFVALQDNPGVCPAPAGTCWLRVVHAETADQKVNMA